MKAGAFEFLSKPLRDNVVSIAIRQALERSRLILARDAEKQGIQKCFASLSPRQRAGHGVGLFRIVKQTGRH
jgi:FixJ family two-component response regulator